MGDDAIDDTISKAGQKKVRSLLFDLMPSLTQLPEPTRKQGMGHAHKIQRSRTCQRGAFCHGKRQQRSQTIQRYDLGRCDPLNVRGLRPVV
jgi:hypothetical protein